METERKKLGQILEIKVKSKEKGKEAYRATNKVRGKVEIKAQDRVKATERTRRKVEPKVEMKEVEGRKANPNYHQEPNRANQVLIQRQPHRDAKKDSFLSMADVYNALRDPPGMVLIAR